VAGTACCSPAGSSARYAVEFNRKLRGLDAAAIAAIGAHRWPGNVRELGNRIRRGAVMSDGPLLSPADLELEPAEEGEMTDLNLRTLRLRAERAALEQALARTQGGLAAAARLLGISRPTIYALLDTHGITAGRRHAEYPTPPPELP
jgi:two-component system, NtrC family, response regulator